MKYKPIIFILIIQILLSMGFVVRGIGNDKLLNGYIIYVDAGHGGKDNGANNNSVLEDSINLSIAKYIVRDLIDMGAYVYTSRDGDYDLASNYDKNRKNKDLKMRVQLINSIKPDIFLSIHLNTYPSESVHGGQVFHQNNEDSKLLANILQDKFNKLSKKDKKSKIGDYYLLNKSNGVGVIIECGFLTNNDDLVNLVKESYQEKISLYICNGIYEYFKENVML